MDDVPRTVLVVDDHPSFRATARAPLEAEGFSVIGEAADGEEALAKTVELDPDLVLLDIQLPDLDGFEVARRLEANGASPAIVLVSSRRRRLRRPDLRVQRPWLRPEGRAH